MAGGRVREDEPQPNQQLDALSYEELKSNIIKQYAKSGVLKSLRTQLRSKILLDIKGKGGVQVDNFVNESENSSIVSNDSSSDDVYGFDDFGPTLGGKRSSSSSASKEKTRQKSKGSTQVYQLHNKENVEKREDSLKTQLLYSVLVSFLKSHGLNYTISVLLSEADISEQLVHTNSLKLLCEMFHREELPFNSKNKKQFSARRFLEGKTNTLEMLYELVAQFMNIHSSSIAIQADTVDIAPKSTVDEKLKALDEQYLRSKDVEVASAKGIEERMLEFQQKCEARCRKEIEEKMAFFEETTLSTMRLEESAKYREKIAIMKEQLENDFREKLKDLNRREEETREALERRQKELEKTSHEHRQNMMKEITKLQNKQNQMRKMELEIERSRQEVAEKARRLEVLHQQTTIDMKTELSVLKQQLESKYEQDCQELEIQRQLFEKEKLQVHLERETINKTYTAHGEVARFKETIEQQSQTIASLKGEVADIRLENKHLKTVCDELRHQNHQYKYQLGSEQTGVPSHLHITLDNKYESLLREKQALEDMQNVSLTKVQDLLKRVAVLENENEKLAKKYESEKRNRTNSGEEQIKQLAEEIRKEKSNLKLMVSKWNLEKNGLQEKIKALEESKEALHREFDEEKLRSKKLSMEYMDGQTLLRETQQALENALKGDSTVELQALSERKDRVIKELQRDIEQLKQEKQAAIKELSQKIEEEVKHSSTLKEALAQNQRILDKAQSSFSDMTQNHEQISKQKETEVTRLQEKYESQLKFEKEKYTQLEDMKTMMEKEAEALNQHVASLREERASLEKSLRECENRLQEAIKNGDKKLQQLEIQISEYFIRHLQYLSPDHAYTIKDRNPLNAERMLYFMGNPQEFAEFVRSQEYALGVPRPTSSQTVPMHPSQTPSIVASKVPQPDQSAMYPTLTEPVSSSQNQFTDNRISPQNTQSQFKEEYVPAPTPTTSMNQPQTHAQLQQQSVASSSSATITAHQSEEKQVVSVEQKSPTRTVQQFGVEELPMELEEPTLMEQQPASSKSSPRDNLITDMKTFTEEFKKQRQEERLEDDFHISGFDESLTNDDLDFIKSSDDDLDDFLGDDNEDDFF